MEQYVKKGISKSNGLEEVMERRKTQKLQELEDLDIDSMIAEKKKKLQEASPTKIDSTHPNFMAFLSSLFAGKAPAEINDILTYLTQEQIDKLKYLSESMNPNNLANLRGVMQPPNSSLKETIEIVKLILSMQQPQQSVNNGFDLKGIAEIFKAGVEAAKVQQPPVQQQQDPMAVYRMVQEIVHPFQEQASNQGKQLVDMRMKELESKIVDPVAYVKNMKSVAADLGFTSSGATNDYTLKKAEMDQTERLETRKLDWEQRKWELDKEKEGSTLETVKEILEGPAGEILKSFGNAGAERLRGNKASSTNGQTQQPQFAKIKCPSCAGDFSANPQLVMIQCPLCGVQLQNSNQASHEQTEHSNQPAPSAPPQEIPKDQPPSDSAQAQPSQNIVKEKPKDETVEAESHVEPITKQ